MLHGILDETTRTDLRDFEPEVAVWPVGATEPHGWHLPFGTDTMTVDAVTRRAVEQANARGARVLMLPALPYGIDTNLMGFAHTLTLKPTTLIAVAGDIIDSLIQHHVPKLLMVNGHGGNTDVMKTICREYTDRDIFIGTINGWALAPDVVEQVIETRTEHACEFETSIALALFPERVQMDAAEDGRTRECRLKKFLEHGGQFTRPWDRYTENSGVGKPQNATREKGEAIVAALVERMTDVLCELSAEERDATFPY